MTIVPGYGNRAAKIMLVGEAPAATEVRTGLPFQGRAGEELNKLLLDAGIRRDDLYITNASLYPVTGDKKKFFFPDGQPSQQFLESIGQLLRDIEEIKPNVVVALGNYALWALTLQQQVMKRRGSMFWSELANVKVIPTIHPAALLRGKPDEGEKAQGGLYKMRTVIVWDLQRAKQQSGFPELRLRERSLLVNPESFDFEYAVDRLRRADKITFDLETFGGTDLACIGFSDGDPSWACTWSYDNNVERFGLFKELLETDVPKTGQNLMYDTTLLDQLGIHTRNIEWDTMIAQHALMPDLPKGLDFMTSIYTDIPYYKDEGKTWKEGAFGPNVHQYYLYNAKDVVATAEIRQEQEKELVAERLVPPFRNSMMVFGPLRGATYDGVACDHAMLMTLINETNEKWAKAQKELDDLAGWSVNVNSHVQVKKLLYEQFKLGNKAQSSDAPTILDIAAKTGHPAPRAVINVREPRKLLSTYYHPGILSADGRIRFGFNVVGTFGARISSSAPLWGPGLNGQNIPVPARRMVIPDSGFTFLEFDQSQAEAVYVAYAANDPVHIDCFRFGKDVHRVTACLLTGMDPNDWQKIDKKAPIRDLTKRCNHAFNYDIGPFEFVRTVNLEYDPEDPSSVKLDNATGREIRNKYLSIRPALQGYWESVRSELKLNRTLTTPFGRRFQFLDQWSDTLLKRAYSYKPQASVGEITNIGICQVFGLRQVEHLEDGGGASQKELKRMGIKFSNQVHDSTLWQVPDECVDEAIPHFFKLLEVPFTLNGYTLTIAIEGMKGKTWYKGDKGKKGDMDNVGISRKSPEAGYE